MSDSTVSGAVISFSDPASDLVSFLISSCSSVLTASVVTASVVTASVVSEDKSPAQAGTQESDMPVIPRVADSKATEILLKVFLYFINNHPYLLKKTNKTYLVCQYGNGHTIVVDKKLRGMQLSIMVK